MVMRSRNHFRSLLLAGALAAGVVAPLPAQTPAPTPPAPTGADVRIAADGPMLSAIAGSTIAAGGEEHWMGEVFPLTYELTVSRKYFQSLGETFTWDPAPLTVEEWSAPDQSDGMVGTENRAFFTRKNRAYSPVAKTVAIAPILQSVNLVTGSSGSGAFAQNNSIDEFFLKSAPARVVIKPLPAGAPDGFANAVGDFKIKATVSPMKARAGESVTWVLQVTGLGNWPDIRSLPARTLSRDFRVTPLPVQRNFKADVLFEGGIKETFVVVPTKAGSYQLPGVSFVYFDPKAARYVTLTSETVTLTVTPGDPAVLARLAKQPAEAPNTQAAAYVPHGIRVPESPPIIPLDPMNHTAFGFGPFSHHALFAEIVVPVALFVLFWLGLATRQRRLTDPLRPRRLARASMAAALQKLGGTTTRPVILAQLHHWQQGAAKFWEVDRRSPTPRDLTKTKAGRVWIELWEESDDVLFSQSAQLPPTWVERAGAALREARLPRLPVTAIFLPRNLFPFAAAGLGLFLLPSTGFAAGGVEAYAAGRFAAAQEALLKEVAAAPTNAQLRYNLALAYAQQDHWTESAVQSLAAFCLHPSDPQIRWQFAMSMERAAINQPVMVAFAHPDRAHRIASRFSPWGWGVAVGVAMVAAAALGGWFLWLAYTGGGAGWRWGAALLALAAVAVAVCGLWSIREYGPLGRQTTAVIVKATTLHSVPTEATSIQKTAPLPAGTMAITGREFLGWSQLIFPNGQTGWVRNDTLTYLYR
jgi:hypothetical protein